MLAVLLASISQLQTASHVCVYNGAAFVMKWKLRDTTAGVDSAQTGDYAVWGTKCLPTSAVGANVTGDELIPVIDAFWGKHGVVADSPVLNDPIAVSPVTYVCTGTTFDYSCKIGPPGPSAGDVAKEIGNFTLGFAEGLALAEGFADCIADVNGTARQLASVIDFFETGFNAKSVSSIVRAFELIGELLNDFVKAIGDCVKDVTALVAKMKDLVAALSGNVLAVIKVLVEAGIKIFHDRQEITTDCKTVAADWRGKDFLGAGKALGDVIGILVNDLGATMVEEN